MNESDETQADPSKVNEHDPQELSPPAAAIEDEVDEFIDRSIQINSNKQMRMEYLHPWTLKFKDTTQESKYCRLREDMFRSNMLCVFIVWVFIVLCQAVIIPRCTILIIFLVVSTIFLTIGCVLVMAEEFSSFPAFLQVCSATLVNHRDYRTIFICVVILLMSIASSIGLFFCPMDLSQSSANSTSFSNPYSMNHSIGTRKTHTNSSNSVDNTNLQTQNITLKLQQFIPDKLNKTQTEVNKTFEKTAPKTKKEIKKEKRNYASSIDTDNNHYFENRVEPCSHPEYLVFTWVLCLIALATGLKLYYLVKTFMATIMVCCYSILISIVFPQVFESASTESLVNSEYGMPLTARMNILLIVFLTMVTYHARLVELTSRLDFIWKEQAEKELSNMKSNRILNDLLIKVLEITLNIIARNATRYILCCRIYFLIMWLVTTYLTDDLMNCMPKCIICVALCLHRFPIFKIFIQRTLKMEKPVFEY